MKNHKWITLSLIICVLLTQLALPTAALANNGAPPPDAPVVDTPVVEVPVVDTPVVEVPVEDTPVVDESVVAEPLTVAEVLADLPEDAPVVVLDENNQPVPLASQEAADTIAMSDPIFCTGNNTPAGSSCSVSYSSLADLLTANKDLDTSADVTIYFTKLIPYSSDDMTLDNTGSNPAIKWKGNLILQGGWNNTDKILESANTKFEVPIKINWTGGNVSIYNITVELPDGNTNAALRVVTEDKNITIKNVTVHQSGGTGDGIYGSGTDITLENVNSTRNYGDGIELSGYNITLKNVTAQDNGFHGASLRTSDGVISVTGGNFSGNHSSGILTVLGRGGATKIYAGEHGLTASNNRYAGIYPSRQGTFTMDYCDDRFVLSGNASAIEGIIIDCPEESSSSPAPTSEPGDDWKHEEHEPAYTTKHLEVSDGQNFDLSCDTNISAYNLSLSGNHVSLPCGSLPADQGINTAALSLIPTTQLPSALDAKYTFMAGLNVNFSTPLNGGMLVSFAIPAGTETSSYTILFWDGSIWVDLGGFLSADGLFNVNANDGGTYILVTK